MAGTIKYRIDFNDGGSQEDESLENINDVRALRPGLVTAIEMQFYVINDPEGIHYDTYQEAEARHNYLMGQYYVGNTNTLLDPQPEGLN